jgi:hypothetical protein
MLGFMEEVTALSKFALTDAIVELAQLKYRLLGSRDRVLQCATINDYIVKEKARCTFAASTI